MKKVDVIIIGGGIVGWVLAYRLAKRGIYRKIMLISSSEAHNASQQNQSWLQSGLLYDLNDPVQRQVAEMCIFSGKFLQEIVGIGKSREYTGIMALPDDAEVGSRLLFMETHGSIYKDPILTPYEVDKALGADFSQSKKFTSKTQFIKTPDCTFQEGYLMRVCETYFRSNVEEAEVIPGIADLKPSLQSKNGFTVNVGGEEYDTNKLFICAGLNTKRLLMPLGLDEKIDIYARRCILLKGRMNTDLKSDMFIDKVNNLNVNAVINDHEGRLLLFGDGLYSRVEDLYNLEDLPKQPTDKEIASFLDNYCNDMSYPGLRDRLAAFASNKNNFSVCYKVEGKSYLPWEFNSDKDNFGYRNIYVAGAGKATLAWHVAGMLLQSAKIEDSLLPYQFTSDGRLGSSQHWSEK